MSHLWDPPDGLKIFGLPDAGLRHLPFDLKFDLDIFVTNFAAENTILTNDWPLVFTGDDATDETDGDGNDLDETDQSYDVALGDFDGDGDLDAIVVNDGTNQILTNQGGVQGGTEGDFVAADAPADPDGALSRGVALGDLDGDGDLDAFVANIGLTRGVGADNQVLFNRGLDPVENAPTFEGATENTGGAQVSHDVALGDLDGDGTLDAYVANDGTDQILFNELGNGTFTRVQQVSDATGNSRSVALGDLDGDGDLDAFVAIGGFIGTRDGAANQVLLNDGSGNLADPNPSAPVAGGSHFSNAVALGDLDGDGDLDAFVANDDANQVLLNKGDGTFEVGLAPAGGTLRSEDVTLADFDDDGDLDVFVSNVGAANQILWNHGDGTFTTFTEVSGTEISTAAAVGDLDGDGETATLDENGLPWLGDDFFGA